MQRTFSSLGLKLNLGLLIFFVIMGSVAAAFILLGFRDSRDSATNLSERALEQLGSQTLQYVAESQADFGAHQMQQAAEIGQRAARYLEIYHASRGEIPIDVSGYAQTEAGVWYDPDPDRTSDVVIPNHARLEGGVLDDIAYSDPLDSLLPAITQSYPGELADEAYYPIAVIFIGVNGVGRYYPAIGVHESTPAELDTSDFYDRFGPVANPERRTAWTTPYEDMVGRGLVITAQTPIYQGDVFRGIFEVDLSIANLGPRIDLVKPSEHGFAFYVDTDGEILETSAKPLLERELAAGNEALARVIEGMRTGERGVTRLELGGEEYFVASTPMLDVGGGFAVVAPIAELTADAAAITAGIDGQADRTMLLVLGSMTALFVVALVAATYLNRRVLVRPIQALSAGTRAVAQGDFATRIEVSGNDELAGLGHSFNQMTADIQREVHEREAAQNELQALFAAMTDMVFVVDREGRFLRVPGTNSPMQDTLPQGRVGQTLYDILPDALADSIVETINQALREHRTATIEFPREVGDRTEWHLAAISPVSEDAIVAVIRDITERVNARQELERQVEERTRQLRALLDVSRDVASRLELQPLLELIVQQVEAVAEYSRASIYLLEGDTLRLLASRLSDPNVAPPPSSHQFDTRNTGSFFRRVLAGQTLLIEDIQADDETGLALREALGSEFPRAVAGVHALLGVPLALSDRVVGMLTLNHAQPGFYTEQHVQLVTAIAAQAAVAIENARLYQRAQQVAALEERQRLARELHDSVSQALYGIALGARTARTLLDTEPRRAVEPVDYVLSLAEAGLAEMRALIFELRPESLQAEGLVTALEKQAAAIRARYGIEVVAELGAEPDLSLAEKEAFYRVAQEALHNVVKHAHASRVRVGLSNSNAHVVLEVRDDGAGFEPGQDFPGHMGLVSMRERCAGIGAALTIESKPGTGTTVRLSLETTGA